MVTNFHTHSTLQHRYYEIKKSQHDLWPELTLLNEKYSSVWNFPDTLTFVFLFCLILSASYHYMNISQPTSCGLTSTYSCGYLASCGMSVLIVAVRHRPLLDWFVARRYLSLPSKSAYNMQRKLLQNRKDCQPQFGIVVLWYINYNIYIYYNYIYIYINNI